MTTPTNIAGMDWGIFPEHDEDQADWKIASAAIDAIEAAPEEKPFFIACGFTSGIAASAGAGFAVANWIMNGDPGMDLEGFALSRFRGRRYDPEDLCAAAIRAYAAYYALSGAKSPPPVLAKA